MEQLTYSNNWNNKLDCDVHTTLRLSGRHNVGDQVEVVDRGVSKGLHEIIGKICIPHISQINEWIANLDTGYSAEECQKIIKNMYPKILNWSNRPIYYYLVKKIKPGRKKKKEEPVQTKMDI